MVRVDIKLICIRNFLEHVDCSTTEIHYGKKNIMANIANRFPYISEICQDLFSIILKETTKVGQMRR